MWKIEEKITKNIMTSLILFIIVSLYVYIQLKAEVNLANFIKSGKDLIYLFFVNKRKNSFRIPLV